MPRQHGQGALVFQEVFIRHLQLAMIVFGGAAAVLLLIQTVLFLRARRRRRAQDGR